MTLTFRSYPQILEDLVAYVLANTSITDMNPGSVSLTFLEGVARADYEQYMSMVDIIRTYNLDTTTGADLDERALEYGLTRLLPTAASGYVVFSIEGRTKVSTVLFSGLPGPIAGQSYIYVDDAIGFSIGASIIVGRGTLQAESPIVVSNITAMGGGAYYLIDLGTNLANSHGTEETVILSQNAPPGSYNTIAAGTEVYIQASDVNPRVNYTTVSAAVIEDGETEVTSVLVRCSQTGSIGNASIGFVGFVSSPSFTGEAVENTETFTNGSDLEDDASLRDRIKQNIQSLSRATRATLLSKIVGISDDTQQATVKSASFIEATMIDQPSYLYIDDGTGFEPSYSGQGFETVVAEATGGERYLQLDNNPLVKASLVSINSEPYAFSGGEKLTFDVDGTSETITLRNVSFRVIAAATAEEVAAEINDLSSIVEARTTGGRKKVIVQAVEINNENIQVKPVAAPDVDANDTLGFPEEIEQKTLFLYKNDILMSKDGGTATMVSNNAETYAIAGGAKLQIIIDNQSLNIAEVNFAAKVPPTWTAQEVVDNINGISPVGGGVPGATAEVTVAGTVRISSNTTNSSTSAVEVNVIGGVLDAQTQLDFPTGSHAGSTSQYELNRYNGQIRLATILTALDKITAGSYNTRGWDRSTTAETYSVTIGDTIVISVNGEANQTFTFPATIAYTAEEVADLINETVGIGRIEGATFFEVDLGGSTYLAIRTNDFGEFKTGTTPNSIEVVSSPASMVFPNGTSTDSQDPNYAHVETDNAESYTIGINQDLIVVLDGDTIDRVFDITCHVAGEITDIDGVSPTTIFDDSGLSTDYAVNDVFVGCKIQFDYDTTTVANRNAVRTISNWDAPSGEFTISVALPAAAAIGDTFKIMPVTAANVVDLLNNPNFTNLSVFADIALSTNGTKVQISALTPGQSKKVQVTGGTANQMSIAFASDGTALGVCTTDSIVGLSVGLPITVNDSVVGAANAYIATITGSGPYTITLDDTFPATSPTNISAYLVDNDAVITDRQGLGFDTSIVEGIDGYKSYTGLLQEVHWQLTGLDTDLSTYPGWAAAGVQIEVAAPVIKTMSFDLDVTPDDGVVLGTITNLIKSQIALYINSRGVGDDVILSEIIYRIQSITGVADVVIITPEDNTVIADNEIPRISEANISIA